MEKFLSAAGLPLVSSPDAFNSSQQLLVSSPAYLLLHLSDVQWFSSSPTVVVLLILCISLPLSFIYIILRTCNSIAQDACCGGFHKSLPANPCNGSSSVKYSQVTKGEMAMEEIHVRIAVYPSPSSSSTFLLLPRSTAVIQLDNMAERGLHGVPLNTDILAAAFLRHRSLSSFFPCL
jgi:hypothetical protein